MHPSLVAGLLVALVGLPAQTVAQVSEPPSAVDPVLAASAAPEPDSEGRLVFEPARWYGWKTLLADGASIGTAWLLVGLGGYVLGAPSIHLVHERPWAALTSLSLRVGVPFACFHLHRAVDDSPDDSGLVALGCALGTMALDAALLAWDDAHVSRLRPDGTREALADWDEADLRRAGGPERLYLAVEGFAGYRAKALLAGARVGLFPRPEVLVAAEGGSTLDGAPFVGVELSVRPFGPPSAFSPLIGVGLAAGLEVPIQLFAGAEHQRPSGLRLSARLTVDYQAGFNVGVGHAF